MGPREEIKRYTLAEYLAMEEASEFRSEFFNGEIHAMAGGTPSHSRIAVNCTNAMTNAFDSKGCEVFESSLMIHVEKLDVVLYPDASVVCGPVESSASSPSLVKNPSLILEVLSKGTSKYDHGAKFFKYQMIPSLRTYVLIEQKEPRVYVAHKSPQGEWRVTDYFGLEGMVELTPLGVSISMADIYRRISF